MNWVLEFVEHPVEAGDKTGLHRSPGHSSALTELSQGKISHLQHNIHKPDFAGNDDLAREYQDTFVDIFMIKIQNTDLSDDCIEQEMIDPTQQNIPATRT